MKSKKFLLRVFIATFVLISCQSIFSQRDSIAKSPIYTQTKTLQFGNEFLNEHKIEISKNIPSNINTTQFSINFAQSYLVYDPVRDPKRLLYNTGLFAGASLLSFGVLWVSPESFSNWDKDQIREDGFFKKWKENVKAGPVWDEDDWVLNWVTHPWAGAVYYMNARGSGFKWWESAIYSTLMSTFFWEYGIEAFAEIPSWQDLIITPVLGSALGECFFIWKGKIIRNEKRVLNSKVLGVASVIIMDPFNEILNVLGYKTKNKIQTYSMIAPIDYDYVTNKPIWGMQVNMQF